MIVRLGFLVAASVAAYAVEQLNVQTSRSSTGRNKPLENGKESIEQHRIRGKEKERFTYSDASLKEKDGEEEEEEEEVKLISSVFDWAHGVAPGMEDDDILPEFEDLFGELERLHYLVKELEEREVKLEGELLEYYGLKEQESDITELQRQLKIKTVETDMLNITVNSLPDERKKLQEEIALGASAKKELEVARSKIKELQRQIQLEANQTKGQLLLLKQQKDAEVEKKMKAVKDLEVEVVELRRKNKELQDEKRELTVKLDAAQAKITALSNMTESEMVART
ncbi:hypothetical protein P3X46_031290 [Hevea brasiliensis]|uniref:Uncharacterized protein n=1 Tax=Hevea brasiliensis TaxID=3981 RepID=A0ABQ9KLQ2_HEVBR|nr:hypothetical protein P3X46_031290 [Hevea brasiliensis]